MLSVTKLPILFALLATAIFLAGCVGPTVECGNGVCETGESPETCPQDCSAPETHLECQAQACVQVQGAGQNQCTTDADCSLVELKTAEILDIPLPENAKCFWGRNREVPECAQFFDDRGSPACPKFYNPVYDSEGIFYPSACWAEQLGVTNYQYGFSDKLKQFISDLWYTPKTGTNNKSYIAPSPNIEFSYQGSGLLGWKNGVFLRSSLWVSGSDYSILDYDINTDMGENTVFTGLRKTYSPAYGETVDTLLIFVMFDDAYPEQVLLDWTATYTPFMNDYITKKQEVPNPIQYNIIPVVIAPPAGVERPSTTHLFFSNDEIQLMYDAAISKLGQSDFNVLVVSPVFLNGFGGYYHTWNGMHFIEAPLHPREAYSDIDKEKGLNALAMFQSMFLTISHEVLHAVGLPGDHFPMGYGTTYLDSIGWLPTDPITGKSREPPMSNCDFYGFSPGYYAIDVPDNLKILVDQEPAWLSKMESDSGPCLAALQENRWLKDFDGDGEYEIMYKNNLVGAELQRFLGWADVDGDGVTELVDSDAYGGYSLHTGYVSTAYCPVPPCTEDETGCECPGDYKLPVVGPFSFNPIQEVTIGNCRFEEVELENQQTGFVPLECAEFNKNVVNIYQGVKYQWLLMEKDFGTVLLAETD